MKKSDCTVVTFSVLCRKGFGGIVGDKLIEASNADSLYCFGDQRREPTAAEWNEAKKQLPDNV